MFEYKRSGQLARRRNRLWSEKSPFRRRSKRNQSRAVHRMGVGWYRLAKRGQVSFSTYPPHSYAFLFIAQFYPLRIPWTKLSLNLIPSLNFTLWIKNEYHLIIPLLKWRKKNLDNTRTRVLLNRKLAVTPVFSARTTFYLHIRSCDVFIWLKTMQVHTLKHSTVENFPKKVRLYSTMEIFPRKSPSWTL